MRSFIKTCQYLFFTIISEVTDMADYNSGRDLSDKLTYTSGNEAKPGILGKIADYFHTIPSRAAGKVNAWLISVIAATALAGGLAATAYFLSKKPATNDAKSVVLKGEAPKTPYSASPADAKPGEAPAGMGYGPTGPAPAPAPTPKPAAPAPAPKPTYEPKPAPKAPAEPDTGVAIDPYKEILPRLPKAEPPKAKPAYEPVILPHERRAIEAEQRKTAPQYTPAPAPKITEAPKQPQPVYIPPAPQPAPKKAPAIKPRTEPESLLDLRAILRAEGYADKETLGASTTGKGIIDLGRWGFSLYGDGFATEQDCGDYDINGSGWRAWAQLHSYLGLGKGIVGYGALGGGIEDRLYTIEFDDGDKFEFGNNSPFATGTLAIAKGELSDPDNFGVGDNKDRLILKVTRHFGKPEGDVKDRGYGDDYNAWRVSADGRVAFLNSVLMDGDTLAAVAGASYLKEEFADFLKQNRISGEAGVRWIFPGHNGYVEPGFVVKDVESRVAGKKTTDMLIGPQFRAGWRVLTGKLATLDLTGEAGYLFSREGDDQGYGAFGGTLWFGQKSK
ncbi:MAG: hypothetical protein QXK08_02910 [Candidatus Woesearchaeota archaeon]